MSRPIRIFTAVLAALLLSQLAFAQKEELPGASGSLPVDPALLADAEVVMLDERGSRIVGRGQVDNDVLRLTVGQRVGDFVLLVVLSDGEVLRFVGREWFGDSFRISLEGGGQVELEDLVSELGLSLRLDRLRPESAASEPTPEPPRGDTGDGDGDDGGDDDGDDGGDDDTGGDGGSDDPDEPSTDDPGDDPDDDDDEDDDDVDDDDDDDDD